MFNDKTKYTCSIVDNMLLVWYFNDLICSTSDKLNINKTRIFICQIQKFKMVLALFKFISFG